MGNKLTKQRGSFETPSPFYNLFLTLDLLGTEPGTGLSAATPANLKTQRKIKIPAKIVVKFHVADPGDAVLGVKN